MTSTKLVNDIKAVVFKHIDPKKAKVFIFGSRALGNNRKFSDVDLGIKIDGGLPFMKKLDIEEDFDNSDLPYRVDVVDFAGVSKNFEEVAMKKVIYLN